MTKETVEAATSKVSKKKSGDYVLSPEFPVGLRVLVVDDDDPLCLQDLEKKLKDCRYEVTTCSSPKIALSMLREEKTKFDIVLSGVHMHDMDGFKLLEQILKEMDLPVIMMSTDENNYAVMESVLKGACDYLIKPIGKQNIQTIWQHVVRKMNKLKELELSGNVEESEQHRKSFEDAGYSSSGNDENGKGSKRRKEGEDETEDKNDTSMPKKPRVVWTTELHNQFAAAVNQLGIDKAVPKKILEIMKNPMITRENVASHLQKYRLYNKKRCSQQDQNTLNVLSIDQDEANFVPISQVDGSLDPQALAFVQLPLHSPALQAGGLGRSHVPTGFDVSHSDQRNIFSSETSKLRIFGAGQHQLTNTNNHVKFLHGLPTSMGLQVNEGASGYLNYTTITGSTGHTDNFVHGNHSSSVMLHMAQSQMSGHLLNGLPSSVGQHMFPNDIASQVLVRNETVVNVRGASYNPLTQPSSDLPMNYTGFPVNDLAFNSTANVHNFTSNGISQDDESCEIFDEINPNRFIDWKFQNMALNFDTPQGNFSTSPPSIFGHHSFVTSQKIEQKENEHGNPDSIVLLHNNLHVESLNGINAEIRSCLSSADSIFLLENLPP
ncbi:SANT/Myb domain [Macleaya cordata]|uniref:Two-component response regulator n=1 Tax=Macleaya cordata TaxID=56857 RepID=A0A200PWK8_MACCD|nr:SANT/Myb domain [Macleaya cordata]